MKRLLLIVLILIIAGVTLLGFNANALMGQTFFVTASDPDIKINDTTDETIDASTAYYDKLKHTFFDYHSYSLDGFSETVDITIHFDHSITHDDLKSFVVIDLETHEALPWIFTNGVEVSVSSNRFAIMYLYDDSELTLPIKLEHGMTDIVLTHDEELNETCVINEDVVIDLNGYTIDYQNSREALFIIEQGCTLTLTDSAVVEGIDYTDDHYNQDTNTLMYSVHQSQMSDDGMHADIFETQYAWQLKGTVNLDGGLLIDNREGNVIIDGGSYCDGKLISMIKGTCQINNAYMVGLDSLIDAHQSQIDICDVICLNHDSPDCSLLMFDDCDVSIDHSQFVKNVSQNGGVINASQSSAVNIHETLFSDNYALEDGGAILLDDSSSLVLDQCDLCMNEATSGGAVMVKNQCRLEVNESRIVGNMANENEGGGLYIDANGTLIFNSGAICRNETKTNDWGGGGLFVAEHGQAQLGMAVITHNHAGGFGGGLSSCSTGKTFILDDSVAIYQNSADGQYMSGDTSAKSEDRIYGYEDSRFMEYGYQDCFSAYESQISTTMLGGGAAHYSGSIDGVKVEEGMDLHAQYIMGLTSHLSESNQQKANHLAEVIITDNESHTHGAGVLINGTLVMGETSTIHHSDAIRIHGYKTLSGNHQSDEMYTFVIKSHNQIISTGHCHQGEIEFNPPLSFNGPGTYEYVIEEVKEQAKNVIYDQTKHHMNITVEEVEEPLSISNVTLISRLVKDVTVDGTQYEINDHHKVIDLDVSDKVEFVNYSADTLTINVKKEWVDLESDEIDVNLLRDNKVINKIKLNEDNQFNYQWANLPTTSDDGDAYDYRVEEATTGYDVSYDNHYDMSIDPEMNQVNQLREDHYYVLADSSSKFLLDVQDDNVIVNKNHSLLIDELDPYTIEDSCLWYYHEGYLINQATQSYLSAIKSRKQFLSVVDTVNQATLWSFDDGLCSDVGGNKRYLTLNNGIFTTSLTNSQAIIYDYNRDHQTIIHQFIITNAPLGTHLSCQIQKINMKNEPLAYALFKVSHNGQILSFEKLEDSYHVVSGIEGNVIMSDEEGMIRLSQLEPGDYTLIEVKAPQGYQITDPVNIHIDDNTTTSVTVVDESEDIVITGVDHNHIKSMIILLLFGILWLVWRRR